MTFSSIPCISPFLQNIQMIKFQDYFHLFTFQMQQQCVPMQNTFKCTHSIGNSSTLLHKSLHLFRFHWIFASFGMLQFVKVIVSNCFYAFIFVPCFLCLFLFYLLHIQRHYLKMPQANQILLGFLSPSSIFLLSIHLNVQILFSL